MNPMTILKVMKKYHLRYVYLVEVNDGKYILKSRYDSSGRKLLKRDVQKAIEEGVTFLE